MFHNATITATHSNFTTVKRDNHNHYNISNGKPTLEILYEQAAPGAFHISNERYDPPKCHEETRITIRRDLQDQVTMTIVSCIIWLYGAAGAGKSAIAQSFAQACEESGLLIGSFFFFRAAPLRNNTERLAASLAYQLARSIPSTLQHIAHCITTHPAIFSSSLEDQIDKLFVQPLRRACEDDPALSPQPRLVILDGLDECDTPKVQQHILTVLEKALQATPIPIIFLVASRPEVHISSSFESLDRRCRIPTFRFGLNDKYDADGDIRIYLNDKFKELKRDHPFKKYLPEVWPDPCDIDSIVRKSSSQFIYAATVVRYIGYERCKPHERLQTALGASQRFTTTVRDSPFNELDALYFQIFSGLDDPATTLAILSLTLGTAGYSAQWPRTIEFILGLNPGDVELHISTLTSLMKFETETEPIFSFHASLWDFLIDEKRSQHLYIQQPAVHTVFSKAYIRRFLESESFPLLSFIVDHLTTAALDQELCDMVIEVEAELPKFIVAFEPQPGSSSAMSLAYWDDDMASDMANHWNSKNHVDLFNCVYKLNNTHRNPAFWDQCLEAIYAVFNTQLTVYLTSEATHDFLVLVAFVEKSDWLPFPFAASLGISAETWNLCSKVSIFARPEGPERPTGVTRTFLQNFLVDPHLSGKLFVTPEQFARLALKCLNIIMEIGTLGPSNAQSLQNALTPTDNKATSYGWAITSMMFMLRRAAECKELIDCLMLLNREWRWLRDDRLRLPIGDCQQAIDSYVRTHSSKASHDDTPTGPGKQSTEETVKDLPVVQGGQKRLRSDSSSGTYASAKVTTLGASGSSDQSGGKRRKGEKF